LKDFIGDKTPAKDGEVRRGAYSGKFFTYDGTKKEWREATAIEKDRYFVLESNAKEFVDIQDVYESIKDDERVIFVLRHAERGDDTSKSGTLTDNGKKQSEEVGARLTKFKDDFVLGASEFLRAHQTVESIAKGRGQSYDKRDTIPQLNDDWYAKNSEAVEKAKNECGGGWEVTSKYAYTGAYSTGADAAYYDLAERSVELIEDVLVKKYPTEKFVLLSSHDKLMVPLVAYCSNLQVELKKYDGGKWINYLAGVAIIIDKDGNRRYVAIRGLKSGYAN
jgi:broad specificity phosphatase PhoE